MLGLQPPRHISTLPQPADLRKTRRAMGRLSSSCGPHSNGRTTLRSDSGNEALLSPHHIELYGLRKWLSSEWSAAMQRHSSGERILERTAQP
jgi:hypothetical protein